MNDIMYNHIYIRTDCIYMQMFVQGNALYLKNKGTN